MDLFRQAQLQYQQLLGQLRAGAISREAFEAAVSQLRVQDAQGTWWTLSPATGSWSYWDGSAWRPATPPAIAPSRSAAPPEEPKAAARDVFDASSEQYRTVLERYQRGELDAAAFGQAVASLRVTDQSGAVWQINPQDGSWVKWDGASWVKAALPKASSPQGLGREVRGSLGQSAAATLSELPGMLIRQFLVRLPVVALTGFSVWAIHSIVLVWKNEGFNCQDPWGPYLNCVGGAGNAGSSAAIWGLPLALFWSTVISFFRSGPTATIKALFNGPARVLSIPSQGGAGLAGFCIGGGIALVLAVIFGLNRQAGAFLTFTSVFLAAGYPGMVLARALGDLWNRVVAPRTPAALNRVRAIFDSAVVGLTPGFLLLAILPPKLRGLAALALLGAGIFLLVSKRATPPAAAATHLPHGGMPALLAWFVSYVATAALFDLFFAATALADDGGSNEIRGGDGTDRLNWTNAIAWWNSQGSGQAIGQGVTPSVSAGVGVGLIPPLAPPTDGLVIVDDVIKGTDTEDGEHFRYEADVRCTADAALIPADGRTSAEFLAIVRTNNPKWTERQMMGTAQFSYTAPTGFTLQPAQEFTDGSSNNAKRVKVICVPPQDAAFAPGTIPGALYLYASCPEGTVNGHAQVQIQVGGGELTINPLERQWIRGPAQGQPTDSLFLFARLQWPDYCTGYTDADEQTLNATITLKGLGERATYIAGCDSAEPAEHWRRWKLEPNPQLQPEHLQDSPSVELGMEGRIMAGLLQKTFSLQVLGAPQVKFDPEAPFLVPDALEQIEVKAAVAGAAPGEEWQIESPIFDSGDQDIVLLGSTEPKPPAETKLTFRLGALPKERDEASASFKVKAKLTKSVKDYAGPTETEEAKLFVNVRRPGLILLTKMPVSIPGDGKTAAKLQITVIRYTPGQGGKPGVLSVDEALLKKKALTFAKEVEADGAAAEAFRVAALQLTYNDVVGEGLNKYASYSIKGSTVVPGTGQSVLGKLEISAPVPKDADERDYTKKLELSLGTLKVDGKGNDYAKAKGKYKDYVTERKLFLKALDDTILRPYSTIEAMRGDMHILEWATEWLQGFVQETPDSSLQKLMDIYTELKAQVDRDTRRDPSFLYQRRVELIERSTAAWAAVARSEGNIGDVMAGGEWLADKTKWMSEAIFPKLVEIAMVTGGSSPRWADFSGSAAGYLQKYLHEYAGSVMELVLSDDPAPWTNGWKKTADKIISELCADWTDLLWGAGYEKAFEEMSKSPLEKGPLALAHGVKVKAHMYGYFFIYKLIQRWGWDKNEDGTHRTFWEALDKVLFEDIAGKALADTLEWFIGEVPKGHDASQFVVAVKEKKNELLKFFSYVELVGEFTKKP